IAGALARSGVDVSVVARGAHLQAIVRDGLRVHSELGDFTVAVPAAADLRELGTFDWIIVTLKAHQWDDVLPQFDGFATTEATLVPMQNGLPFWYFHDRSLNCVDPGGRLRAQFPDDRIVGTVVHASGNVPSPGVVHQSGGRLYPMGELNGCSSERLERLSAMFVRAGLDAPAQPAIRREVWRKLLGNASLNPVSTLTRSTIGAMLDDPDTRALIAEVMRETIAVAKAAGCDPEIEVNERIAFASRLTDVKTSMLQDFEANRPLELDPIVGAVVELAGEFGVDAPRTASVYALAKRLDRASRA
ncbi:MAG: 2-dehydropantoate 2-reductase, partial [Candidatus Eremiobacteraeota bacterium]|nr:2-dehydropantoate 2-reductase [Candidatus Eremiobacteraeota bacterium]